MELFACARVHVTYNVALRFMDSVEELRESKPGTNGHDTHLTIAQKDDEIWWLIKLTESCVAVRLCYVAAALYPVLKRLCDVFSLHSLLEESNTLLESGYANGHQVQMLRDQVRHTQHNTNM